MRRAARTPPSGPRTETGAGSRDASSRCAGPMGSRSTGARRRPSSPSSRAARAQRSSPSFAWCRLPREPSPLLHLRQLMMPSRSTTTIETAGSPARRRGGTGSPRFLGRIRHTRTCAMRTTMASCANSPREGARSVLVPSPSRRPIVSLSPKGNHAMFGVSFPLAIVYLTPLKI